MKRRDTFRLIPLSIIGAGSFVRETKGAEDFRDLERGSDAGPEE